MAISSNGDKYFSNVSLLLPFDGANGSTTFYDASPVPKAVTTVGNTNISTVYSKFGGGSAYFDGTGDYLTVADSNDFAFGSSDFTIECWIYPTVSPGAFYKGIVGQRNLFTSDNSFLLVIFGDGRVQLDFSTTGNSITHTLLLGYFSLNNWYHLAVARSGNTIRGFVNGVLGQSLNVTGISLYNSTQLVHIGRLGIGEPGYDFAGYIDSLRITKGLARYTASFTPPTAPFPTDWEDVADPYYDNVVLHLPMDGPENGTTFIDRSKTPKTITTVGNTKLLAAQSKFGGRSCYFDGNDDYLTVPGSTDFDLPGDFTIESWVLLSGYSGPFNGVYAGVIASRYYGYAGTDKGWQVRVEGTVSSYDYIQVYTGINGFYFPASLNLNTWYHIAVTRSGTSLKVFLDGVQVGATVTNSDLFTQSIQNPLYIGRLNDLSYMYYLNGYIDSLRITKGVARYTSNFTVPTGPFAIGKPYVADPYASNVSLLLTGSGANGTQVFRDESGAYKTITAIGNTVVDRNRGRVGGGSIYFDGVGDWITVKADTSLTLGTADFTIECWFYSTAPSASGDRYLFGSADTNSGASGLYWFSVSETEVRFNGYSIPYLTASYSIPLQTWHHVAVCRSSGNLKIYIDGVVAASGTCSNSLTIGPHFTVGGGSSTAQFGNTWQGYIGNFRVTKGIARYTANFTPGYSYLLPPTAITSGDALYDNTVLTLRLDGNYVDSSPKNNTVTAYGNASLSTSTYKYGTGSLSLDGVGDYIATPDIADFRFGTGDFCMECWVYPTMTSFADINCIFDHKTGSPSGWYLYLNWQGKVELYNSSSYLTGNTALTKNVWTHIAVTRSSGSVTIWVNGVADCTPSSGGINTDYTGATTYFGIGALINQRDSRYDFKGYIDNVRITKGAARYTTTFTPADIESSSIGGPVRAYSVESITSNGAVKFTIPVAGVIQAGFSTNASTDITKNDLEYSIQIDSSKVLTIVEAGVVKATKGTASDGTNFEIEYSGTTMTYKSNGAQLLTTTVPAEMVLYFSAFIEDTGLYVTGIQIGTYASDGTPGNISGQITADNISTYIAGAAIDTAYIKDLAVKTAKIDNLAVTTGKINDLAVETLKIAGNSISKVYAASGGTIVINDISAINDPLVQVTNIAVPGSSTAVVIIFNATYYNNTSATRGFANFELRRDNQYILDIVGYDSTFFSIETGAGDIYTITKVFVDNAVTSGTHSYQMKPQVPSAWTINTNGNLLLKDITLYAVPLLR